MERTPLDILLENYRKGILTETERLLLSRMLVAPENQPELEALIDKGFGDAELRELGDEETRELIYQQINLHREDRVIRMGGVGKKWWLGAAAAVVILFGAGIYLLNKPQKRVVVVQSQEERFKNEVAPGGNKAILTLGNGSAIVLDTAKNGTIAQQGGIKVLKLADGQLVYAGKEGHDIVYNRVSTPRGGEYKLSLPDGTMIWLNSGSSIRYPTSFTGNERKVEVSGEAYFEVARDVARPFKVKIISAMGDGGEVQVLGTHFNINSYDDEAGIRTTLLEGSVKVLAGGDGVLLEPGQQAEVRVTKGGAGPIRLIRDADAGDAVAWVKGIFKFKQVTIGPLMRAIARWYDVDVEYEGTVNSHFILTIPRNLPVTDVFKILEQTGEVHFKIEGKKVTVMP